MMVLSAAAMACYIHSSCDCMCASLPISLHKIDVRTIREIGKSKWVLVFQCVCKWDSLVFLYPFSCTNVEERGIHRYNPQSQRRRHPTTKVKIHIRTLLNIY